MRKAVVLFNLGGPSSREEIEPFLESLFSDPAILPFYSWIRKPLARLIAARRKTSAQEIYDKIGGKSPLLENTFAQAQALETSLGKEYRVFVAMRHAHPFIREVVKEVKDYKPDEVVLLPLYPQFSTTTTASAFNEWGHQAKIQQFIRPQQLTCCYPEVTGFVEAVSDLILTELLRFSQDFPLADTPRLLFSAHGLPKYIVKKGDPYTHQVEKSFKKVVKFIQKKTQTQLETALCYQSRVGPLAWTGPSLEEELKKAGHDKKNVLVVPISFVSEHSETLVELDIEYAEKAKEWGVPQYARVPTVGCHPLFIEGLARLVKERAGKVSCSVGWKKCWRR